MPKRFLPLLVLFAAAACADAGPTAGVVPEPAERTLQSVSQAVAAALAQPQVRADVRDAMRSSPLVEHRLAFPAFLRSPAGRSMADAMAASMDTDHAGVMRALARLPDLDFYVATRQDRRTWQATDDVAVAAALRLPESRVLSAFTPGGATIPVSYEARHPGAVVFHITPAGERFRRVRPQADVRGLVIEDEDDGTYGGRFTWTPAGGRSVTVDLADLEGAARNGGAGGAEGGGGLPTAADTTGDGGGGPGGGGVPAAADTTRLDYFYIHYADGCGLPDPSFIAKHYNAAGVVTGEGRLDYSEMPRHDHLYPRVPLILRRIRQGTGERINLQIVDRDSWFCGGDDDMGNRDYVASENGLTATIFTGGTPRMNAQLGWTPKY